MARRGSRKQPPGERVGNSTSTRANDQAAQCSTHGDTYDPWNGYSSSRYIISGNNVPHPTTLAPATLQRVQNGFLGPSPGEGPPTAPKVGQEDKLCMQPSFMQVQSDPDWQNSVDEEAWSRQRHVEVPFAEDWSAADQYTDIDSTAMGANMSCEDVLMGIDVTAAAPEVSVDFGLEMTDPYPDVPISNPLYTGSANAPPWSTFSSNDSERMQFQQGFSMSVDGPRTSTSLSTRIEHTPESSFINIDPAAMSSISSLSHPEEDLAVSNLAMLMDQQAHMNPDSTALDLRNIDPRFLHPQYPGPSYSTQTYSEDGHTGPASIPLADKYCPTCNAKFSGRFRASNLARHKRIQHNGGLKLLCLEQTCNKAFARQDARLKHVRKHHPGLVSDAVPRPERRKGFENTRTSPV